jgi:hypothetical protein
MREALADRTQAGKFKELDRKRKKAAKMAGFNRLFSPMSSNLEWPQYRLRVDKTRVFFDVEADLVTIIAIMPKERCQEWLEKYGKTTKED